MLQLKLNKLDIEFIKLWSEYIVTRDSNEIMDRLQDLAKKGQLNAIQSWYSFKKKGDCEEIDNIVKSLEGNTYEELWTLGNYEGSTDEARDSLNKLYKRRNELIDTINYRNETETYTRSTGRFLTTHYPDTSKEEAEKETIETSIENVPCINYWLRGAGKVLQYAKDMQNPYLAQRAGEMYNSLAQLLPHRNQKLGKTLKQKALRYFTKTYKKMQKTEEGKDVNANLQFYYHFARSILTSETKKTLRPLAIDILKEICNYDKLEKEALE
ncbi:MAG: hypothetical protein J6A28_04615 [Clostridia bacterium]|nr:hypothetical protein [Clostridia bacterium]